MLDPVTEETLGAAAAEFPLVKCVCPTCEGTCEVSDFYEPSERIACHECGGVGYYLREMDAREEHYYIMHLLKTRYQLR